MTRAPVGPPIAPIGLTGRYSPLAQLDKRMEGGTHVGRRGAQVVVGGDDRLWVRPCAVALMSRPVQVTIEASGGGATER